MNTIHIEQAGGTIRIVIPVKYEDDDYFEIAHSHEDCVPAVAAIFNFFADMVLFCNCQPTIHTISSDDKIELRVVLPGNGDGVRFVDELTVYLSETDRFKHVYHGIRFNIVRKFVQNQVYEFPPPEPAVHLVISPN